MSVNCDPECQEMLRLRREKKKHNVRICGPCGQLVLAESIGRPGQIQAMPMGAEMDAPSHMGMTPEEFEQYASENNMSEESVEKMGKERDNSNIIYPSKLKALSIETSGGPVIVDVKGSAHPVYTMPSVPDSYYFLVPDKSGERQNKIGFYAGNGSTKAVNVAFAFQGADLGVFRVDPGEGVTVDEFPETGASIMLGLISGNPLGEDAGLLSVIVTVVETPFSRRNSQTPASMMKNMTMDDDMMKKDKKKDKKKNKKSKQPSQEDMEGTPNASPIGSNFSKVNFEGYEVTDAGVPVEILEAYARVVRISSDLVAPAASEPGVPIKKVNTKPPLPKNIGM